jgi:hypothetical protein
LPAVQKVRESAAGQNAGQTIKQIGAAAQRFHSATGDYPATLGQLASFTTCLPCLTAVTGGYRFAITLATATQWTAVAEPFLPGITGSITLTVDQSGKVTTLPTPGADQARQAMFNQVLGNGASLIAALLKLDPNTVSQVRSFVHSPSNIPTTFQSLSVPSPAGAQVTFSSILSFNQYRELVGAFLAFLPLAMHLGAGNENLTTLSGVSLADLSGTPLTIDVFNYPGLCKMTGVYETSQQIAYSLCAKLSAAEEAEERGNAQEQVDALNAYGNEVEAQTQNSLTQHQADVLLTLAKVLYPAGRF